MNDHIDNEHEEIESLLPWYVNGTLSAEDHQRVKRYIAAHPEMESQLAALRDDQISDISANEIIHSDSETALQRLMNSIESEKPEMRRRTKSTNTIMSQVEVWVRSLSPTGLTLAAVTGAIVIIVQAGLLTMLLWYLPEGETVYRTASGGQESTEIKALVQFNKDAKLEDISRFLSKHQVQILAGPKPGGFYTIGFSADAVEKTSRLELLNKLSANKALVTLVLPAK